MRSIRVIMAVALICGAGTVAASGLFPASAATAGSQGDAVADTRRAAKMIQEQQLSEAIELLDRVIDKEDGYWEAHYQRGRALAMVDRMEEGRDALLRAVELNPGFAHGHYLAWLAAFNLGDYDIAWEQAIQAEIAGTDMSARFQQLVEVSTVPEDILQRLSAPRIFIGSIDTTDIETEAELPHNMNPGGEDTPVVGRPDRILGGAALVGESTAELVGLHRELQLVVVRAPYLALTKDPAQAAYVVRLLVERLGETSPRELDGFIEVLNKQTQKVSYQRDIRLRDIASHGALMPQLDQLFADIEAELVQVTTAQ